VDVRRRGVSGVQADISIRGGGFDQSLLLINGINLSDIQTGHHLMNIPINVEDIERIEILKGPGARVYGQNAFSGAINIVTKKSRKYAANIFASYSQNVTGRIGFASTIPVDNGAHQFSYSKSFSEGYRYNTDYDVDNVWYQSEFDLGKDRLMFMAGYTFRAFGANGFYASPSARDQFEEIGTSIVSAKYSHKSGSWTIKPSVFWRRNQDEYIFIRSNPSIYRNLHIGNSIGAEINASQINALGILGIGVDSRFDFIQSNNLGDRDRTSLGVNLEQRMIIGSKLDITPGIAAYSYSDFGSRLFPGLDVGYGLSEQIKFYGNIGSTWRVPTYTDLFYEDPANLGNPNLLPEKALTTELGIKFRDKTWDIQLSWFSRNSENLIDWTKENPADQWFPSNIGNVDISGIELNAQFDFTSLYGKNLPKLMVGYSRLSGENNVEAPISRYALEYIQNHLTAGADMKWNDHLSQSLYMKYVDRLTLDSYMVLDAKFTIKINNINLSLFSNNLLDTDYTETNLVPMPGRWSGLEINYKIK
jgi:iron complex outermembrane receptor protein